MPGIADPGLRKRAELAILEHIAEHGPKDWKLVRDQFPDVKERTFHNWIKVIRAGGSMPEPIKAKARERVRKPDILQHLPVTPPPHYAAKDGAQVDVDMDFMARARLIEHDLMMVREATLFEKGESREGKPRNLGMMMKTVDGRLKSLDTGLKIMERIYDLQFMAEYLNAVVEIIRNRVSDPREWAMIGEDVADLNAKYNMTLAAGS